VAGVVQLEPAASSSAPLPAHHYHHQVPVGEAVQPVVGGAGLMPSHGHSLSPLLMSWSSAYPPAGLPSAPMHTMMPYGSVEDRGLDMQSLSASLDRSKRRKLSADERLERSRERNRIHAKKTRLRKKQKMELLLHRKQELLDEQMRLKETIRDREAAPILLGMRHFSNGIHEPSPGTQGVNAEVGLEGSTSPGSVRPAQPELEEGGDGGSDSDTEASDDSMPSHAGMSNSGASSVTSSQTKTSRQTASTHSSADGGDEERESSLYLELLKRDRSTLTAAETDLIRRERNRLHAKRTRDRKKQQQEETQQEIAKLEKENRRLRDVICRLGVPPNYTVSRETALLLPLEDTCRVIEERRKAEEAAALLQRSKVQSFGAHAPTVGGHPRLPSAVAAGGSITSPSSASSLSAAPAASGSILGGRSTGGGSLGSSTPSAPPALSAMSATVGVAASAATAGGGGGGLPTGKPGARRRSPQSDDSTTDSNKTTEEERSGNGTSANGSSSAAASDLCTSGTGTGSSSGNGMSDLSSSGGSQRGYGSNGSSGHVDGESNSDSGSNGTGSDGGHGLRHHGFGESNSDSGSTGGRAADAEDSSGSNSPPVPTGGTGSSGNSGSEEDEDQARSPPDRLAAAEADSSSCSSSSSSPN